MQVLKRDGRTTEFNKQKIVDAIVSAMQHTIKGVDETIAYKIAEEIEKQVEGKETISVYDIQDIVEKKLMNSSRKEVAQRYIIYRYNRDVARRSKTKDIFLVFVIIFIYFIYLKTTFYKKKGEKNHAKRRKAHTD